MTKVSIFSEVAGIVAEMLVESGQQVRKGKKLVVIESMKMEIPIESNYIGVIEEIFIRKDDTIAQNQVIMTIRLKR